MILPIQGLASGLVLSLSLIALGWFLSYRRILPAESFLPLNRFLVDIAFPMMIFQQLVETTSLPILKEKWSLPVLGALLYLTGVLVSFLLTRLPLMPLRKSQKPTLIFLCSTPNWIFLPLMILQPSLGAEGVRTILLFHLGFLISLWTVGIWVLKGHRVHLSEFFLILKNPALWATVLGLLFIFYFPVSLSSLKASSTLIFSSPLLFAGSFLYQICLYVGKIALPLSFLMTGIMLHKSSFWPQGGDGWGGLFFVLVTRLCLIPWVVFFLFRFLRGTYFPMTDQEFLTGVIIGAMPVAINNASLCHRFNGDTSLATLSIFYTHFFILLSLPLLMLSWW